MLCYVMLCYVMLCYVMLCYVIIDVAYAVLLISPQTLEGMGFSGDLDTTESEVSPNRR